jgi:hypothetical protein
MSAEAVQWAVVAILLLLALLLAALADWVVNGWRSYRAFRRYIDSDVMPEPNPRTVVRQRWRVPL